MLLCYCEVMHSLVEVCEVGEYLTVHVCGGWACDSQVTSDVVKLDEERGLGRGGEEGRREKRERRRRGWRGWRRERGREKMVGGDGEGKRVGRKREEANRGKEGHVVNLLALYICIQM